jgi:hypothetical protein
MLKMLAYAIAAALVTAIILAALAGGAGYLIWRHGHNPPIADLSEGKLPLTFKTSSPSLQAKLKELAAKKELPNQYPPPEFEAVSQRLWASLSQLLASKEFDKLLASADAFEDLRAQEPRYAEWPDDSITHEKMEDFLKFIRFNLDGALAPFKEDTPFLKAEEFADSVAGINIPSRRPDGAEGDIADLLELCKLKLFIALADGRRAKALRMLDMLFKLSGSPLCSGLYAETARMDAASCACAMLKALPWTGREAQAFSRLIAKEAARPFPATKMILAERLSTLEDFERERAGYDRIVDTMSIVRDLNGYYADNGATGLLLALEDAYASLTRDIDMEELKELELLDALERGGRLKEEDVETFKAKLGRGGDLSGAEQSLLWNYATPRSRSETMFRKVEEALQTPVEKQPRKE